MTNATNKGTTMDKGSKKNFGLMDTYTRLAPSVEKEWVEAFVLEQRCPSPRAPSFGQSPLIRYGAGSAGSYCSPCRSPFCSSCVNRSVRSASWPC